MRTGTIFRTFPSKNGQEVTLRAPQWSDLDDMLDFINSLVDESAPILKEIKMTRNGEIDWLARLLSRVEKAKMIAVVAEVEGKFVGQVEVTPGTERSNHLGNLGISLKDGFRDVGIGSEMMKEAEEQSKELGIEVIQLEVFANNERAIHVYEKAGFNVVGRIPKGARISESYVDVLIMAKELFP
jgi:ribosomal protein S18 acetylase RimI-like enzyme